MKKFIYIISVLLFALAIGSCSKRGIVLSTADLKTDNFWTNQSGKIVHRNNRYAKMEERDDRIMEKRKDKVEKILAKEKKKNKSYLAVVPFEFH